MIYVGIYKTILEYWCLQLQFYRKLRNREKHTGKIYPKNTIGIVDNNKRSFIKNLRITTCLKLCCSEANM